MRASTPALLAAAALLAVPIAGRAAEPAPKAQVTVAIGAELAAKGKRYGVREFDVLSKDLADQVSRAAAKGGFSRVDLVLEDARPNRPTFAMQSRSTSLSLRSIAVGGAKITGTAYGPNGAQPLKSSWYETDLRQEYGPWTWSDAERAFSFLASDLSRGKTPQRYGPGTPSADERPYDPADPWTRED